MTTYIFRRLLQAAATLFLLSLLFFLLLHVNTTGQCVTEGCTEQLHLDQPIANQYVWWVGGLLRGDLGMTATGQPIMGLVRQDFPPTAILVLTSLLLQQLVALPLGIFAALRPYSWFDGLLTTFSYVALSLPAFLVGNFLIFLFAVAWPHLPVAHSSDPALPILGSADWFLALFHDPAQILGDAGRHLALPVITLAFTGAAIDSRFMRAAMLQVVRQDYIRTARAKGAGRGRVIFKHALRNALLPIVTNLGLYIPALIAGVVVVEAVFTWNGLGSLFALAIIGGPNQEGDLPTLQALVMLSAVAVVLANLLADLAYAWLDPRIRFHSEDGS